MNCIRYLLAIGVLAFMGYAQAADWGQDKIDEIINNVQDIWNTVTGNVKDTAADLKRQLTLLQQQGDTLKETAIDTLGFLQHRRETFRGLRQRRHGAVRRRLGVLGFPHGPGDIRPRHGGSEAQVPANRATGARRRGAPR